MKRTLRSQMEQIARTLGLEPCPVRERLLQTLDDIELMDEQSHHEVAARSLREEQQEAPQQKRA